MAKKKAAKPVKNTAWVQPAFDPRIYTLKMLDKNNSLSTSLRRGMIKQALPVSGFKQTLNQVSFLYNPSQVTASYALAAEDAQAVAFAPQVNDDAQLRVPLNQSINFSILFDRTYELWDSSKKSTPAGTYGCMVDVWAVQQLVGMNAAPGGPDSTSSSNSNSQTGNMGLMQTVFCWFYFGGRQSLTFFGAPQSIDITYTHWTQLMVPMRCVVAMTVNLYPTEIATAKQGKGKKKQDAGNWSQIPGIGQPLPTTGPGSNLGSTGVGGR